MRQRDQLGAFKIGHRPGNHQQAAVVPVPAHLVQKDHLVGKDVRRIAAIVVEEAQVVVEETRRAGRRDNPGCPDIGNVLPAPVHAALTFLDGERLLGAVRHVIDHGVPDRTGVLRHVHIDAIEFGEHVDAQWAGVIHVENRRGAVGQHDSGVTDRAVGRCTQRDDHDVQIALGSGQPVFD